MKLPLRILPSIARSVPALLILLLPASPLHAQDSLYVLRHFAKREVLIPMRDGVKLFTSVYSPRDTTQSYPVMLNRTPYSVAPYGSDTMKSTLGPSSAFQRDGFIFVYQDVRGRMMSEGEFEDMRPYVPRKQGRQHIDESSDTYDTIDWLVNHVAHNNGKVGIWGISYPGFYAAMSLIDAHPALKAVSPQAPIADWYIGDDFHHNGALYLLDAFHFFSGFGQPRPAPTTASAKGVDLKTPDAYRFFLTLGALPNANERFFHGKIAFWNDLMAHESYDAFWKARNILPHLRNVTPAVLIVGGLFDAEDLYGPLSIYRTIEKESPGTNSRIVLGPWQHGGWARDDGDSLGDVRFGAKHSVRFRENVELPFFRQFLKGGPDPRLPEALVFETGSNEWHSHDRWPPAVAETTFYFGEKSSLTPEPPGAKNGLDEYLSDPDRPVPYTQHIRPSRGVEYIAEDQRFAWSRPDVLSYETGPVRGPVHAAGPVTADLFVALSGTDADFIVKLIDVFPDSLPDRSVDPRAVHPGGYQMLVRAEVIRGKFRNSYEKSEPFTPGVVTPVRFALRDVHHAFLPGHRIMIQVQSSWFPLVDRNPQKFMNIYDAVDSDFQKETIRVYRQAGAASRVILHKELSNR
jgi:putative CocE/NonD family hydrolase